MSMHLRACQVIAFATFAGTGSAFAQNGPIRIQPSEVQVGLPEQVVYTRSSDDVLNAGMLFQPTKGSPSQVAVIWVHGWGSNFYLPSYVGIGRSLAKRGYTTISVNTRMHDIGNVEKYTQAGKRVRGGGYWGVTSQDARDIAAWVDFAEHLGFRKVVVVGHSAGWASVAHYEAESRDRRVVGLVLASGMTGAAQSNDPDLVAQAKKLVDAGSGEDLLRLPNRSFPAFISAATYLNMENAPRAYKDFFGTNTTDAGVTKITCPLLAFFGTTDDVGGAADLIKLKACIQRLHSGPRRVDTTSIVGGNHEYVGQELQVAQKVSKWIETVV